MSREIFAYVSDSNEIPVTIQRAKELAASFDMGMAPTDNVQAVDELDYFRQELGLLKKAGFSFYRIYTGVYVHDGSSPYVSGMLTYRDHTENREGGAKYTVESPFITNNRYGYGRNRFRKGSVDLRKARKIALGYLRKLTDEQHIKWTYQSYSYEIRDRQYQDNFAINQAWEAVQEHDSLKIELPNIVYGRQSHIVNTELHGLVQRYDALVQEEKVKNASGQLAFVCIGQEELPAITVTDIAPTTPGNGYNIDIADVPHTFTPSTLPEEIRGKLSVLNMVEPNTAVIGVGMKMSEDMFYVIY